MPLRLDDRWVWDFWLADTGTDFHVFYLQAPRDLRDPDLRHANATVGHAVSDDLRTWRVLPDALHSGEPGWWDDRAIWTGSVIERDHRWYMFYTGTSHADAGLVQRIGLATSDDLVAWTRHGTQPVIEADERWYETLGTSTWHEQAWRDPWIVDIDGTFHALVTARSNHGRDDGRGVIGHAVSADLVHWDVQPPLSQPGEFAHLEVPQLVDLGDHHILVFSCDAARVSADRLARLAGSQRDAVYTVTSPDALGPFDIRAAAPDLPEGLYSGRLISNRDGDLVWLAFHDATPERSFPGELSDPIPFTERTR